MFGHRYFGARYFGPRYWGEGGNTPPTPGVTVVIGGAGHPIYKRRNWRETKQVIEEGLQSAYEEIVAAGLPVDVMGEAVKIVKPFADKQARFKSQPRAAEIDWKAMERDVKLARRLMEIHAEHVGIERELQLQEEEDELILLLH